MTSFKNATKFKISDLPKLLGDIKLYLALLATWCKTQTMCANNTWFSLGSRATNFLICSIRWDSAAASQSLTDGPLNNGFGKFLKKSFNNPARSKAGEERSSSQAPVPIWSMRSRSSLRALALAHLRKIPWVWGPLWKSPSSMAFRTGDSVPFGHIRDSGNPNILLVLLRKSFNGVLKQRISFKNSQLSLVLFYCSSVRLLEILYLKIWCMHG